MNKESPFTLNRFEYEREHLYFLPKETFPKLEDSKPTYLVGTRGTGKTTLLQALTWSERLHRPSLRQQLGDDPFAKEYIGVYLKLPKYELARIEEWLKVEMEGDRGTILGFFIDLIWIELLVDALAELVLLKTLKAQPDEEHALIERILSSHPEIVLNLRRGEQVTLKQFASVVRRLRREIETSARINDKPQLLLRILPSGQVGEFGRSLSRCFAEFCNKTSSNRKARWHFKVAMDEAECLTRFQQRVLNTAVRLSEAPVSYVASYVSLPEDSSTTLMPTLTLQEADRHLIVLDELTDGEFKQLSEGVATVRVRTKLVNKKVRFDFVRLLGNLDIDAIIENICNASVNPKAKELIAKAREMHTDPFLSESNVNSGRKALSSKRSQRPASLYKVYLIERLKLEIPSPDKHVWERRRQDSAELRKKMVAAYLSICAELNVQVRYGFADMVLQMSDKCIRDFLAQLHEIFEEVNLELKEFLRKAVPLPKQDKALKRASKQKKESIPKSGVDLALEIGRLVDALGQITAIVQTTGPNYAHLRSPERGRFVLDTRNRNPEDSVLLKMVAEAGEAGFLRILKREESVVEFQVHCSLAAEYRFSYRGAYYTTPVTFSDLRRLSQATDSEQRRVAIAEIGERLSGEAQLNESPQMRLI